MNTRPTIILLFLKGNQDFAAFFRIITTIGISKIITPTGIRYKYQFEEEEGG